MPSVVFNLPGRLAGLLLALGACAPTEIATLPPPPAASAPAPALVERARFSGALEAAAPVRASAASEAAALAARAEALRARAGRLAAPVLDPGTRARLDAERGG